MAELKQEMGLGFRVSIFTGYKRAPEASSGFQAAKQLNTPLRPGGGKEGALNKLHCGRAPGSDGLRAEHLRITYIEFEDGRVVREYALV